MAKKPTGADADKKADLEAQFAAIKKAQHFFAMQLGKNGVVFMSHKRWAPEVLERKLRKAGGSAKGAKGIANLSGKVLELQCDDLSSAPSTMDKKAKMEWKELGLPFRVSLIEMTAEARAELENAEGDGEEENAEAAETAEATGAEGETSENTAAGGEGGGSGDGAGGTEASEGGDAEGAANEEAPAQATEEDLVTSLQREYEELQPKIEGAAESENKGFAKKVAGLNTMFETQIEGNAKKARAVLGLLQTTIQAGIDAGDMTFAAMGEEQEPQAANPDGGEEEEDLQMSTGDAGDGAAAPDPAVLEARRSRIADLERSVDDLLAQFAAG